MKYKSLVSDVSRTLSMRLSTASFRKECGCTRKECGCTTITKPKQRVAFHHLPVEILDYIFYLVDLVEDYRRCLYVLRLFYYFSKPYFYEQVTFTLTYRFAQFVTYLRVNPDVGQYVKSVDLLGIRSGEEMVEEVGGLHIVAPRVLAGWRDWKVKSNPLFLVPQTEPANTDLAKTASHMLALSLALSKYTLASVKRLFKRRKKEKRKERKGRGRRVTSRHASGHANNGYGSRNVSRNVGDSSDSSDDSGNTTEYPLRRRHPPMNKYLLNYLSSRDVPIGYVLHLVNLCPNVELLNLGGVLLSMDYEVHRAHTYKYSTFDLTHNYPRLLARDVASLMDLLEYGDQLLCASAIRSHSLAVSIMGFGMAREGVGVGGGGGVGVPSLLSALAAPETSRGDGRVFLSDLNLKSLNPAYLTRLDERELLCAIVAVHGHGLRLRITRDRYSGARVTEHELQYLDLSLMVWLTREMVVDFLRELVGEREKEKNTEKEMIRGSSLYSSSAESLVLDSEDDAEEYLRDLVVDLTNLGMYKNLAWAQVIDMATTEGRRLVRAILEDRLEDLHDARARRDRRRRGRIGENYN